MKSRAKSFIKAATMALLVSTLFISCGKDNKSGGSSPSNTPVVTDPWSGGSTNVGNGNSLPSNWINVLYNEYSCNTGANNNTRVRMQVQAQGPITINASALHVAVTLEGDILVMSNTNNVVSMELHACQRPGMQNTAQFIQKPVLNVSYQCAMGEVTAADILLNSQNGPYSLVFFPAGLSSPSSLCQSQQYQ